MDLNLVWFVLLSLLMAGYAILDGFDLGVGIIHPVLRGKEQRAVAIKAIGPLWDGNEVWLVTFGGALFAAFPEAYATLLSAMYLPVMLLLFFLILRAVSVDFYSKVESSFWKLFWDVGFVVSSLGATVVFGVAVGNLIQGFAIDQRGSYTGGLGDLFTPFTMATGLLATTTFAMHGAMFLFLKSTGSVKQRLRGWMWHTWGAFLVCYILVSMMTLIENQHVVENVRQMPWAIPVVILNVVCVANIPRAILNERYGQAFISSCLNIACLVVVFAQSTFPNLVYSTAESNSTAESKSIDIYNGASSQGTLWIMCVIAMIGLPLILSYTGIVYWTFRQPIELAED